MVWRCRIIRVIAGRCSGGTLIDLMDITIRQAVGCPAIEIKCLMDTTSSLVGSNQLALPLLMGWQRRLREILVLQLANFSHCYLINSWWFHQICECLFHHFTLFIGKSLWFMCLETNSIFLFNWDLFIIFWEAPEYIWQCCKIVVLMVVFGCIY